MEMKPGVCWLQITTCTVRTVTVKMKGCISIILSEITLGIGIYRIYEITDVMNEESGK